MQRHMTSRPVRRIGVAGRGPRARPFAEGRSRSSGRRGLEPNRVKTLRRSSDPRFEEKFVDVVGLYLNPPERSCSACTKFAHSTVGSPQPPLPIKPDPCRSPSTFLTPIKTLLTPSGHPG